MREVRSLIAHYCAVEEPVLLYGETGTGKGLAAVAIHHGSRRGDQEAVTAVLAGLRETARSELFGHKKGAFTGALRDHEGYFREADGSSLILEDISDIPMEVQPILLRAIEEGRFRPVGEKEDATADVRVLATTNVRLDREVKEGRFRADLYYRLGVLRLDPPPLRKHLEDLEVYVPHFLKENARPGFEPKIMSREGMDHLGRHDWPGNVRELENLLRQVSVRAKGPTIEGDEIARLLSAEPLPRMPETPDRRPIDKEALCHALAHSGGNKREAARRLGVHRDTFYSLLKKFGVSL